tara:strand:- start:485 stop:898 length:414 start_codon:yes stop_codon:yes gene_type:complete
MKTSLASALILLTLLGGSGCRTEGAFKPINTTRYDFENESSFVLMDRSMQRSVTVSGLQETVGDDGRLEVVANVRNRVNRRLHVQIGCVFKNEAGFSTSDETPWQTLILTEAEQKSIRFVSMNDKAKRYTIRVRQAR